MDWQVIVATAQLVAAVVLVGVTWWYAREVGRQRRDGALPVIVFDSLDAATAAEIDNPMLVPSATPTANVFKITIKNSGLGPALNLRVKVQGDGFTYAAPATTAPYESRPAALPIGEKLSLIFLAQGTPQQQGEGVMKARETGSVGTLVVRYVDAYRRSFVSRSSLEIQDSAQFPSPMPALRLGALELLGPK